jgi:hypothetical protein
MAREADPAQFANSERSIPLLVVSTEFTDSSPLLSRKWQMHRQLIARWSSRDSKAYTTCVSIAIRFRGRFPAGIAKMTLEIAHFQIDDEPGRR